MKARTFAPLLTAVLIASCSPREHDGADTAAATATRDTVGQVAGDWVAAPGLPAGAEMMVVSGNPGQAGEFTAHLRVPNDYRFPPHTHPAAENVRVLSGTLHVGMGETYDLSRNITELKAGQTIDIAANDPHYAHAAGETVLEVRSTGPFAVTYVNPADDPARR